MTDRAHALAWWRYEHANRRAADHYAAHRRFLDGYTTCLHCGRATYATDETCTRCRLNPTEDR